MYSGPSSLASAHSTRCLSRHCSPTDLHIADYMLDVVLKSSRSDVKRMVRAFAESEIEANNNVVHSDLCAQRLSVSPQLMSIAVMKRRTSRRSIRQHSRRR